MLATLGDLVEDVVVRLGGPIRPATDTPARVSRRRGGSAANVAAVAARRGAPVRFLGQVGDDAIGRALVGELAALGVDTSCVRTGGSTGTIVVLVDETGERTMLTDRRACLALADPDPAWLDGVTTLHVPFYSFAGRPLSETSQAVVDDAHARGIAVSVDLSSVVLLDELGREGAIRLLERIAPDVVFANADEARAIGIDGPLAGAVTVVKRGAGPVTVHVPGRPAVDVPALDLRKVPDTTGAGDAFAAGFLVADWNADAPAAAGAGHRAAADLIADR